MNSNVYLILIIEHEDKKEKHEIEAKSINTKEIRLNKYKINESQQM
jgi:hypothetical protein